MPKKDFFPVLLFLWISNFPNISNFFINPLMNLSTWISYDILLYSLEFSINLLNYQATIKTQPKVLERWEYLSNIILKFTLGLEVSNAETLSILEFYRICFRQFWFTSFNKYLKMFLIPQESHKTCRLISVVKWRQSFQRKTTDLKSVWNCFRRIFVANRFNRSSKWNIKWPDCIHLHLFSFTTFC